MFRRLGGLLAAGCLAGSALLATALPAAATIANCTGAADASVSGHVDLTTAEEWNVVRADVVNATGGSKDKLSGVLVNAVVFSLPIPVYSNSSDGTGGGAGPFNVSDFSRYGRVIYVSGSAGGGVCTGHIKITVTDESPFTTLISIVAEIAFIVGLLILLALMFAGASCFSRVIGFVFGLLAGLGLGIELIELGVLDPASAIGLVVPAVGAILGAVLPGVLHPAAASAVSPPPASA